MRLGVGFFGVVGCIDWFVGGGLLFVVVGSVEDSAATELMLDFRLRFLGIDFLGSTMASSSGDCSREDTVFRTRTASLSSLLAGFVCWC